MVGPVVVDLVERVGDADADELWPVYDAVFGDATSRDAWLDQVWRRHAAREGFRCARARVGGALVGFAYGHTGERGQWWTDAVARTLPADVVVEWVGGHFELVSLGVVEGARRRGTGRLLLDALTDGLPHHRWLLMTSADEADPARRLYARQGWEVLGPGPGTDRAVLGRRRL